VSGGGSGRGVNPLRGWGLALRVARREALRNKGRSLLVVAMLALPVAGASAADTLWRSSQVTGPEQAVRDMGRYDAMVIFRGDTPIYQNVDGNRSAPADTVANPATANPASGNPASPASQGNPANPANPDAALGAWVSNTNPTSSS